MESCFTTPCLGNSYISRKDLNFIAVEHALAELIKVLEAIRPGREIDSRNRMNLPEGMFGLSLKLFMKRQANPDIGFIDDIKIICPVTLQHAKNCIVLDDIREFIHQLAVGYKSRKLRGVYREIKQSVRLLGIHEEIFENLTRNLKLHEHLEEQLQSYEGELKRQNRLIDLRATNRRQDIFEEKHINGPIVYRYRCKFEASFQNCQQSFVNEEAEISKKIKEIFTQHRREIYSSISVQRMLEYEIYDFRKRIKKMEAQYAKGMDEVCNMQSYRVNSIDIMESKKRDLRNRLKMFAEQKPKLLEWNAEWEEKQKEEKRREFLALIQQKKKNKNKKKR